MFTRLIVTLVILRGVAASAEECRAATWANKRDVQAVPTAWPPIQPHMPLTIRAASNNDTLAPGDVMCRGYGYTDAEVNYYTCTALANFYNVDLAKFFALNPSIKDDCSNIAPNTQYCVAGAVQPAFNADLSCSTTTPCSLLGAFCCNSQTWTCGNSSTDCSAGICYSGFCDGDSRYTTTGKCGKQNGYRVCAGPWGDCCSTDGNCGTGDAFCAADRCQSGNCAGPPVPSLGSGIALNDTSITRDGTCGGSNGYKCDVIYGWCCSAQGQCGVLPEHCNKSQGCQSQFGNCTDDTTTSVSSTSSATILSASTSILASN